MKYVCLSLLAGCFLGVSARADLTIVQNVEGAGPVSTMTIKIKGDKARIEATPQVASIIDSKSGEILNVMNEQKKFMRMSARQAKAAAEMALKDNKKSGEKPKLKATGKKEMINGYEALEYLCETPEFTATYWISTTYPKAAEIVKQLQAMTPDAWGVAGQGMPDYRDFPGLPLRSRVSMSGQQITSTLVTVKQDPLPDSEFAPPKGFEEMKMPDLDALLGDKPAAEKPAAAKPAVSPKP